MADAITPIELLRLFVQEDQATVANNMYGFLKACTKKVTRQSEIKWKATVQLSTATRSPVTDNNAAKSSNVARPARIPIGNHRIEETFEVMRTDLEEAAATGTGAMRDLFAEKSSDAFEIILRDLAGLLHTGDGAAAQAEVGGLTLAGAVDGTYAMIDQTTYPLWQGVVNGNSGVNRDLTVDLLDTLEAQILNTGSNYTALLVNPLIAKEYRGLFTNVAQQININAQDKTDFLALPGSDLFYHGRPVIVDSYAPANLLRFVDMGKIELFSRQVRGSVMNAGTGMHFLVAPLPSSNTMALLFNITLLPQLRVRNRRAVGTLDDLNQ